MLYFMNISLLPQQNLMFLTHSFFSLDILSCVTCFNVLVHNCFLAFKYTLNLLLLTANYLLSFFLCRPILGVLVPLGLWPFCCVSKFLFIFSRHLFLFFLLSTPPRYLNKPVAENQLFFRVVMVKKRLFNCHR